VQAGACHFLFIGPARTVDTVVMLDATEALATARQQQQAGNLPEAEKWFQYALQLRPSDFDALQGLGRLYLTSGRFADAAAVFGQALQANPDIFEIQNDLGIAQAELGLVDEAVGHFKEAIRLQPGFVEAHSNLALAQLRRQQPLEAAASARRAIELHPDLIGAHISLGDALQAQGKMSEALECLQQALRLRPDSAELHNARGVALARSAKEDEAVLCFQRAIELRPGYVRAYSNLGTALHNLGRSDEALRYLDEALRLAPEDPYLHTGRGLIWLRQGDFERGWPEYEWRLRLSEMGSRDLIQHQWRGEALEGRTLVILGEQGIGDTIQLVRYVPFVHQRGGRVIFVCQGSLTRLLTGFPGIGELVASGSPLPAFHALTPLASLPGVFGTSLSNVPAAVPYLSADPGLLQLWGQRLGSHRNFKIGIAWQGSRDNPDDYRRSVPVEAFQPLAKLPGVHLFSLQKGPGSEQLRRVAHAWPITNLAGRLDDLMDTAAVMKQLDLVVTVDTAIAHLAGALAVPVYVALAFVADWRWLVNRDDSPWYPTMRLFRQRERGAWSEVFSRIAATIARR
jgi:tetratricopeptide (TPR) repeat protein